jgi:3-dehydroquinate dehydratase/shikimate dehydrogenase
MKMICVSVCAETAGELVENIKKAQRSADVIEVRFDCLPPEEMEKVLADWPDTEKQLLATFRPRDQGGKRELTIAERENFWQAVGLFNWADIETDMPGAIKGKRAGKLICSYHNFTGTPENLSDVYEDLKSAGADVIKIAVQTDDITGGLPLWKLLQKAKAEKIQLVPIAMGEAGKWTRILGLAYGAPMTYAALETGKEIAPGQISAEDLRDVYRVKELDEETEIYGTIGFPIAHSLSPYMQNEAFKITGHRAVFIPLEVKDLDSFIKRFLPESGLNIKGLSVTIPHKQTIMKYLDEIDETAQKIGAVNTVRIVDGKLHGFNTDALGFITPLKKAYSSLPGAKAAILGAGGAARACIYALQKEGVAVTVFARDLKKAEPLAEKFDIELKELPITNYQLPDIVINATPLGTKGETEHQSIIDARQFEGVSLAYDLVYNPSVTRFMREAQNAGVPKVLGGMEMLVAQGAEQFRIWTGQTAPAEEMRSAVLRRFQTWI